MLTKRSFLIVALSFLIIVFITLPGLAKGYDQSKISPPRILSASELDYPPFSIVKKDGTADGFSVELLRAAAHAINREISFSIGPWNKIKQQLIDGYFDVLPLVSYSEDRDKVLDFSTPYLRMHGTIFVRKGETSIQGEADLKNKEVLVMKGDTAHEYALARKLTDRLILKESFEEAMKDLSNGKHDALIVQQLVGFQLIKKLKISNVVDTGSIKETSLKPDVHPLSGFEQKFCFAVPEGNKELLSLLNEGLSLVIADGTFDRLYHKWFGPILPAPPVNYALMIKYLLTILVPILFLLSIVGIWVLKKEVAGKTKYLKDEIIQRELTQKALQESEEKFKKMFEHAPLSYQALDKNGDFIEVNATWLTVLGYQRHEVIGKNFSDFLHPDWKDHFRENFPRFKAVGEILGVEFEMVKKDGSLIFVSLHGKTGKDQHNHFNRTHCMFQDITKSRKAEKESEKNKSILLEAEKLAGLGGWQWDIEKDLWYVSENWKNIHGCPDSCLSSAQLLKIAHPQDLSRIQAVMDLVIETGGLYEVEHRIINQTTNEIRYIRAYGEASLDESGKTVNMFGAALDVTDQKVLEAKVLQAQKMESIGNLAGGIAHDFNNLLFPIIGNAELLMEDLSSESPEYENAQEIYMAGKRGGDLVKQILSFSRQEEHKLIPIRMNKVLKEVLKLSRASIPANIDIIGDIQTDSGLIMADPTQIHQIAMNLITNAYHAVRAKNGKIEILLKEIALEESVDRSLPLGRYAMLSVSDNGTGIPKDMLAKVFEPYFTTKEKGRGTGLGLSVVFGIVKEHKGDIKVYSEIGKGTSFKVFLPIMEKAADSLPREEIEELQPGNERILLVDDERSVVQLETRILKRLGYKVTSCFNSLEALKTFETDSLAYDLIITDMTMPGMTGDLLAKKILAIRPDIPVIVCTGFSERMSQTQAGAMGVKGYLMKPVVKSDMAKMIRRVLDEVNPMPQVQPEKRDS